MLKKNEKYKMSEAVRFIWSYVKLHQPLFWLIMFLSAITSLIQVIYPAVFGQIIDSFLDKKLIFGLNLQTVLIVWGLLVIVKIIIDRVKTRLTVWMEVEVERKLTEDLVTQLLSVPVRYHYDQKPGMVYKKIDRAVNSMNMIIESFMFAFVDNLLMIIMSLVVMSRINLLLSAINFVAIFSFLIFAMTFRLEAILNIRKKVNKRYNQLFGNIGDFLANIFTVKSNTAEDFEIKRVSKDYSQANILVNKQMRLWTQVSMGQALIQNAGIILTVALGSYFLNNKMLSAGEFVTFLVYLPMIYAPLWWMTNQYRGIKKMIVDIADAKKILGLAREKSAVNEMEPAQFSGALEFKNVSFKYPERDHEVLDKISFKIKPGETLAIFGETGAGKTTLYNLLLKLYEQDEGEILFDGINSRELGRNFLRNQMAVVPQDPSLFNESILYNIKYGNPQASYDEVIKTAKIANAHDFIKSLPNGYQTKVGERGVKLSGGQVQRIAIARAALRNPKILILDEATTSLDQKTKFAVLDALKNLIKGRTTIIITHDFSAITQSADQIIVLDKGKIAQSGKHQQLVATPGLYCDLWQTQQKHLQ